MAKNRVTFFVDLITKLEQGRSLSAAGLVRCQGLYLTLCILFISVWFFISKRRQVIPPLSRLYSIIFSSSTARRPCCFDVHPYRSGLVLQAAPLFLKEKTK